MQVATVNNKLNNPVVSKINKQQNVNFHSYEDSQYSVAEKMLIGTTTALGVLGSLALLSKGAGYGINPFKGNGGIKQSYLAKVKFRTKEIVGIGAGSCLGGFAGGCLVDNDKNNRKAKMKEFVMQIGNITIPIVTVDFVVDKLCKNTNKYIKALGGIAGIFAGVYLANFCMNKLGNFLFNTTKDRGVKISDYSAHIDDMVVAAQYISDSEIINYISRIIPVALMVAGNEVGNKKA